jgi:hypothetical protein
MFITISSGVKVDSNTRWSNFTVLSNKGMQIFMCFPVYIQSRRAELRPCSANHVLREMIFL